MPLYHYTGGQVKPIPIGPTGGAAGLLHYVGGKVVRPSLYRYVGGQVKNLGTSTMTIGAFTATPSTGVAPLTVQFATSAATSYVWNFGDGTTSTAQNPSHTYAAGTYTATLTVTSAAGSGTTSRVVTVSAGQQAVLTTSSTLATSPSLLTQG